MSFGLGGPEIGVPRPQFKPHFDARRAAGLHSVPHAGETTGPETIWDSLRLLGAERIGHGTSATQDPELLDYLAEAGIPLEVCPTSNIATRAVATLDEHPIMEMVRARGRGHDQLRRSADVRHHPQPRVRRRRRDCSTSTSRDSRAWPRTPSTRRSLPTTSSSASPAELAAY